MSGRDNPPDNPTEAYADKWHQGSHIDGARLEAPLELEFDLVIIGSGAGGGIAAERLSEAGYRIAIIEEGPLRTREHFNMEERSAYPTLYQEAAARKTKDKAIGILQGRCVGGSTTVNWTTSIRTPANTLAYWRQAFDVQETAPADLDPWFSWAEQRLNIHPWPVPPNRNNALLQQGCLALDWHSQVISRNVRGCYNLGYCGMGCPVDAKQSMLVTTLPTAMGQGATLLSRMSVERLLWQGDRVNAVICRPRDQYQQLRNGPKVIIRAREFVLSAGAIGSPSILMRSGAPDPHQRLGKRTFLHPTLISGALMSDPVHPDQGAPQSIYSDQFLWRAGGDGAASGPMGFKLEVPPIHPVLLATKLIGHGKTHAEMMAKMPQLQVSLALLRDGFHPDSPGGQVELRGDGSPVLDYPFSPYLVEGFREALLRMAELQFAVGAESVLPMHESARMYTSWRQAKRNIERLDLAPRQLTVASAHVMGGCGMAGDPDHGVVDRFGRHFQLENLTLMDGSVFPTSLGANPQLSIYGLSARNVDQLLTRLKTA